MHGFQVKSYSNMNNQMLLLQYNRFQQKKPAPNTQLTLEEQIIRFSLSNRLMFTITSAQNQMTVWHWNTQVEKTTILSGSMVVVKQKISIKIRFQVIGIREAYLSQ